MRKGQIRAIARRFVDELAPESWTNEALDEFINVAYEVRRAQIVGLHKLDFVKTYDYTYPADTTFVTYQTISDFLDPVGAARLGAELGGFDVMEWVYVEDVSSASNPVEVGYVPWMRRNEVYAASGTRLSEARRDVGYYWSYKGDEFWIIQKPSSALSLRLHVIPPFVPFQIYPRGEESIPEFRLFNRLLAIDAAVFAREAVGDGQNNLLTVRKELEDAMVKAYSERNSSEPDYIAAYADDFSTGRGAV